MIKKIEARALTNESIKKMKSLKPILSFVDEKIRKACSEGIKTIEIKQEELPKGKYKFEAIEAALENENYITVMSNNFITTKHPKTGVLTYKDNFVLTIYW